MYILFSWFGCIMLSKLSIYSNSSDLIITRCPEEINNCLQHFHVFLFGQKGNIIKGWPGRFLGFSSSLPWIFPSISMEYDCNSTCGDHREDASSNTTFLETSLVHCWITTFQSFSLIIIAHTYVTDCLFL